MSASLYQIPTLDAITNFPYCEFPVTSLDLKEILLLCEVLGLLSRTVEPKTVPHNWVVEPIAPDCRQLFHNGIVEESL